MEVMSVGVTEEPVGPGSFVGAGAGGTDKSTLLIIYSRRSLAHIHLPYPGSLGNDALLKKEAVIEAKRVAETRGKSLMQLVVEAERGIKATKDWPHAHRFLTMVRKELESK